MGIVSMGVLRKRSTAGDNTSKAGDAGVAGADDPLPSIDEQLDSLREPAVAASGSGEQPGAAKLKIRPGVGFFVALALLAMGTALVLIFPPDFVRLPSSDQPVDGGSATSDGANESTNGQPATPPSAGMQRLDAPDFGYSLDYRATWTLVSRQKVARGEGDQPDSDPTLFHISADNAFSIRTFDLAEPVAGDRLADMRAVTDAILSTPKAKLTVLDVRATEVGRLPAVYYLYYFPSGRQQGVHAHYFVFDGRRMHSLVFQVVPATDFPNFAADFDAVIASFKRTP